MESRSFTDAERLRKRPRASPNQSHKAVHGLAWVPMLSFKVRTDEIRSPVSPASDHNFVRFLRVANRGLREPQPKYLLGLIDAAQLKTSERLQASVTASRGLSEPRREQDLLAKRFTELFHSNHLIDRRSNHGDRWISALKGLLNHSCEMGPRANCCSRTDLNSRRHV